MSLLVPLGEVSDINPRPPKGVSDDYEVSFLPMAALSEDGYVAFEEKRSYGEVKKGFTYFERGDFLIAKITPCFENGKAALTSSIKNPIGYGSTEFHVLRAHEKKLDKNYLFHLLRSKQFRFFGEKEMRGAAGQKRISADFIKSYRIPLPNLKEQKRIAAILDKADAIRRKRQKTIELADQFIRSIFLDMFGDPITNPKGWPVFSLRDITSKIGSGATPKGGESSYKKQGITLIRSMNVHDDLFSHKGLAFIDDDQAGTLKNVIVQSNDVLLNITGASVTRCSIVDNAVLPARVNQHVAIVRPNFKKTNSEYLCSCLTNKSYKRLLLLLAKKAGATREALTKSSVEELQIPVPPVRMQEKFRKIYRKMKEKNTKLISTLEHFDDLFDSLTQHAFHGDLTKDKAA